MALDRDLNVAIVAASLPQHRGALGLDLLAATGVRGLRLLTETDAFRGFVLGEGSPEAVAVLGRNARARADRGARAVRIDARRVPMRVAFDYVDLDPFGTPVPFLDVAGALLRENGLLAVTATDMPVLAGVTGAVTLRRYGGRSIRGRLGPEAGLRLLLAELARRARAQGRAIRPVAAYVHDHHVRAFVRWTARSDDADPVGTVDPATFAGPALPPGGPYGPLWTGPLFDEEIAKRLTVPATPARPREAARWIERFRAEAPAPGLFYYEPNEIARGLGLPEPPRPDDVVEELRALGHRAGRSHVREAAIRTPAPREAVDEAARRALARAG
jgi:tRNA (guanine26-N2/guanine27-N2)-dimethyltransferase